jgi:hypothetical protein
MAFFTNNKTEFASLSGEYFDRQWTNVELDMLDPAEQEIITNFHVAASGENQIELDTSDVLLAQAEGGFLKDIFAASLRSNEGELVIKLGKTLYPVTIEESERTIGKRVIKEKLFTAGSLFGSLEFADGDPSKTKTKIDGAEVEVSYTKCWIEFGDGTNFWRVNIGFDLSKYPDKQTIGTAIDAGTLANYLKPAVNSGGSGGEAIGMETLGEGSFDVDGYRVVTTKKGDRYIIKLSDGQETWSRGGAEKQLRSDTERAKLDAAFAAGVPVKLAIGNIQIKETKDDKKIYLDCALRFKAPTPVKEMVAAGAAPAAAKDPSYDDIPF